MVRFKNRWLLIEFIPCQSETSTHEQLNAKAIWLALKQSVMTNFGDIGWGAISTSLTVKYFSPTTNLCIIRVARDHHRIAWGAITLLTSINGNHTIPHLVHLSGTIKHAQLAAIKHDREVIARYRARSSEKMQTIRGHSYDEYLHQSEKEIEAIQD
ncbi:hypothetical protein K439DRAFT_1652012 [Ramaria rubella]|nr:hypothetical protein K439DRAFT_1652012 [Ramaria rubella]